MVGFLDEMKRIFKTSCCLVLVHLPVSGTETKKVHVFRALPPAVTAIGDRFLTSRNITFEVRDLIDVEHQVSCWLCCFVVCRVSDAAQCAGYIGCGELDTDDHHCRARRSHIKWVESTQLPSPGQKKKNTHLETPRQEDRFVGVLRDKVDRPRRKHELKTLVNVTVEAEGLVQLRRHLHLPRVPSTAAA